LATLLVTLATIAFVAGAAGWLVAAVACINVFSMAPAGTRWQIYNRLGMWRHHEIAQLVGDPAQPWLRLMRRGALAFLAGAVVGIVLMLLANLSAA
jgi:hypothetical protein